MSPIEAGAFAVDQHNEAMKWMQALLQNSARPSGALVMDKEASMGDEQFARLQAQIEEQYSGATNAGRPMLLENGLDWKQMSLSPSDMSILETKFSSARDVALAFGVPPQLLGIPGDATYSNYKEARLAFYEDTVIPLLGHLLGTFNPWLEEPFGGAYIMPNLDSIPAIADKRQDKWAMIDKSRELTINERREAKGYPPLEQVVPGEDGNRLIGPDRAEAAPNTDEGKALLSRLAYGS
jgi:HK97 family phage portal protein